MNSKQQIVVELRKELLLLQGFKAASPDAAKVDLGMMNGCFPNSTFPTGNVHEIISTIDSEKSAASAFVCAVAGMLMKRSGPGIWISTKNEIYPPALNQFNVPAERIVFVKAKRELDVCWALEEALKTDGLAFVAGQVQDLSFTTSRRLQLAVEKSQVTGFILRHSPNSVNPTACVSRMKIQPLRSELADGLPGIGDPRWRVIVEKVRNGVPGVFDLVWVKDHFITRIPQTGEVIIDIDRRKIS
ncbi:protein ImuA [Chitinophaga terrae (ex Kim and Jung 2007)]|uniref:Protein ImuA n=1 Tax=Chitinophaga terrae (ex Kim and Jung 2007) TaxID=408074 RepID=A0A1H4GBY5_9BACT|nr:hypothetical protein [Chitinophaga terrae (ex Kim and Jung 2007)]GEP93292.1 hypothetical protein CTE07_49370 [Chitinophaga terrae (ex Kim and Jung 2007)]SEB06977.1 protein ImuA [Chitinophaga terrae (ex Kim and Jung 2007)]